jgi:hypothetical protein
MQDHRYKKVREKLDRMNFLEFLNPDSIELADKMVDYIIKLVDDMKKDKKTQRRQPDPHPDYKSLEHKFNLLNDTYGALKQEHEALKSQAPQADIDLKITTL